LHFLQKETEVKIHVAVRCQAGVICSRSFRIAVDSELAGKRIRVKCPSCMAELKVAIPAQPKHSNSTDEPDVLDKLEDAVSGIVEKTGEFIRAILPD